MEMRNTRAPTVEELDKWVADVLDGRINTEADDTLTIDSEADDASTDVETEDASTIDARRGRGWC